MSSFKYKNVYINDLYSVIGPYEKKGNIKHYDYSSETLNFEEKTFEKAEVKMQTTAIDGLLKRLNLKEEKVDLLIAGDLNNQITTSSVTASKYNIPFLGIYSACASFNEALIIGANNLNKLKKIIVYTSSHNLNSEKQFRYPIEYGAPKKECTTFTATASVAAILSKEESKIKIESSTIGKVTDYGIKDANNMGAVMAPAAYETLNSHLKDLKREATYYDLIVTGDLGSVGSKLFLELLKHNNIKIKKHLDCGTCIYKDEQDVKAGSSGPVTLPLILFNTILKDKKNKKILLLATGSLHSPNLVNQKNTIPSISHAISLEVSK